MAGTNVQFAVAAHIMAALGIRYGEALSSSTLAKSVNADPTFVRKALSRLAKAGLVVTTRGKNGACALARAPEEITLRDVYLASDAPPAFMLHSYPVEQMCPVSANLRSCLSAVQSQTQRSIEETLAATTVADMVANIRRRVKTSRKRT